MKNITFIALLAAVVVLGGLQLLQIAYPLSVAVIVIACLLGELVVLVRR